MNTPRQSNDNDANTLKKLNKNLENANLGLDDKNEVGCC